MTDLTNVCVAKVSDGNGLDLGFLHKRIIIESTNVFCSRGEYLKRSLLQVTYYFIQNISSKFSCISFRVIKTF